MINTILQDIDVAEDELETPTIPEKETPEGEEICSVEETLDEDEEEEE